MELSQPGENPFDYDWEALQAAVNEPISDCPSTGLFSNITLESLAEEPSDPDWWGVQDATADLPSDATSHGQEMIKVAELQPDQ